MPEPIVTLLARNGAAFQLRQLGQDDVLPLAEYFASLSRETRCRFGPHPLTAEYAQQLVSLPQDSAVRFVLQDNHHIRVRLAGYFILEQSMSPHEQERYLARGIELKPGADLIFAPSVGDDYQGQGLASLVMPELIQFAREQGARSLVLMGGTQATNQPAIGFYEKFGFEYHGGFQTEVYNHDMRLLL